ncbi:MAG: lysophospholipid acyltransferase family protein [Anaerolineaceae bacterium]
MSQKKHLNEYILKYPYPRRRIIRNVLRGAIKLAASVITDYRIEGQENLPKQGPLLIVGNHFHFLDSIGPIHCTDYPLEFINDTIMPNAPATMKFLPGLWGTLKILQGSANLEAMRASEAVLAQGGVLAIFPEGHVHSLPLDKPLPGASFMALRSGVRILPIGTYSEDEWDLFGALTRKKRRARIISRIGKPFGPLAPGDLDKIPGREEVKAAGWEIMSHIADLLPAHARGIYATSLFEPEPAAN